MNALRKLLWVVLFGVMTVNAQEESNFWQLGVGYNFVDDSGPRLNDYFNFKEIWHAVPYPSRLTVGYYLTNGFGFEAIGSYNEYDAGKIVDGMILMEDQTYVALDGKVSYDLNKVFGNTGWFDPYLMTGLGYTWIGAADRATFNAGGGFNIWFSPIVGFNLNSMAKWGLFTDKGTNHLQHSLGLVFRLGQKDDMEPFEENEGRGTQSQDDTRTGINSTLEGAMVEDTANKELRDAQEEEVLVASAPIPERSEDELRRERIAEALKDLPVVYFAFNSSYLQEGDRTVLNKLIAFMNTYPEVVIEVQAHADSRGTDEYNDWLAARRAQRIVDHVVAGGIAPDRIRGEGFGESRILNHCLNGVKCTEAEHRDNRRTTYVLVH